MSNVSQSSIEERTTLSDGDSLYNPALIILANASNLLSDHRDQPHPHSVHGWGDWGASGAPSSLELASDDTTYFGYVQTDGVRLSPATLGHDIRLSAGMYFCCPRG